MLDNDTRTESSTAYANTTINLSDNSGHSEHVRLAAYNNNLYAVWIDDTSGSRDIYFKRSTDDGCTFDGTINLSNQSGGSIDPEIAVSGNNLYVVWEHTPVDNGAIFFTKNTDGGAKLFFYY